MFDFIHEAMIREEFVINRRNKKRQLKLI